MISVLALGIGVNTALFSIVDRVLLHPFPFRDLDRLVELDAGATELNREENQYFARRVHSFDRTLIWTWENVVLTGVDDTDSIFLLEVGEHTFDTLGVPPALGRTFTAADYDTASPPVAVISDRLWRKHYHADREIVGKQVLLDGAGYTVVGVMGPEFVFTNPAHQAWIPFKSNWTKREELSHGFTSIALLRPGATVVQAQKEVNATMPGLPRKPGRSEELRVTVKPFADQFTAPYRKALMMLWAAVGLVLLIACANAANLLLARASSRRREFAIRASLGADRWRLAMQLVSETLALGVAAGIAGVALGLALVRLLLAVFPNRSPVPRLDAVSINPAALAVTLGLVLLTTLLCAIPACAGLWRSDLTGGIGIASRTVSSSRAANRTRSALLAFEVALSLMLLIGAGLMLHTLDRLMRVNLGFDPEHVLVAQVSAPSQLKKLEEKSAHYAHMLEETRALPGVLNVGLATVLPFGGLTATVSLSVEGVPDSQWRNYGIYLREISPGYCQAMGIHLLRGRYFNQSDTGSAQSVAIVNREFAQHYWPGQDPIGKHISNDDHPKANEWTTVVGVVDSIKHASLDGNPTAELYRPYTQSMLGAKYTYLVMRVKGDPLAIASSVRRRIHEIDPGQPVTSVSPMRTLVDDSAVEVRFHTLLLEIFAALALGLAIAGIFAVVSYAVTQRTREIGIREALGAAPGDVIRFVLAIAIRPVAVGACVGIAGALAATRVLQSELFETAPADPVVFTVVAAVLIATSVAAASLPAWRATRIDPAEVLRAD